MPVQPEHYVLSDPSIPHDKHNQKSRHEKAQNTTRQSITACMIRASIKPHFVSSVTFRGKLLFCLPRSDHRLRLATAIPDQAAVPEVNKMDESQAGAAETPVPNSCFSNKLEVGLFREYIHGQAHFFNIRRGPHSAFCLELDAKCLIFVIASRICGGTLNIGMKV